MADMSLNTFQQIDRRRVPPIWSQRVTYVLDQSTVKESTRVTEKPYDPEAWEKDGKLLIIVQGPISEEGAGYAQLEEIDAIVGQERNPARIRQKWGDCETDK